MRADLIYIPLSDYDSEESSRSPLEARLAVIALLFATYLLLSPAYASAPQARSLIIVYYELAIELESEQLGSDGGGGTHLRRLARGKEKIRGESSLLLALFLSLSPTRSLLSVAHQIRHEPKFIHGQAMSLTGL